MQKLIETLKQFGIEVPTEKHAEVKKALSEHYKNAAEHTKAIGKLETERDSWKERAETAEETLKKFDGKDVDAMQREIDDWKKKAEDAEKNFNAKEAEREKQELLKEAFADIEFTSNAAKNAIMAQIADGVTVKNGKLIGFNDLLEDAKKNDASAFVDKKQQSLEQNKARFTNPMNNQNRNDVNLTKKDIMAIKDPVERQRKIAENMSLFQK